MSEYPKDAGMDLCGKIDSEDELQQWLQAAFEDAGWTAIREAAPHWSDYRADLIVEHGEFGWFGIETKYIGSSQGPVDMAKAHHQIVQKYRGKKYIGNKIDLWAVCPYIKYANCQKRPGESDEERRQRKDFERLKSESVYALSSFFKHTGIGWIDLDHYALSFDFVEGDSSGRVPTRKLAESEKVQQNREQYMEYVEGWFDRVDVARIRRWAENSVQAAHYGRPDVIKQPQEEVAGDD